MTNTDKLYLIAWILTTVAVSTAIIVTESAMPLWFMLLPGVLDWGDKDK
ncbi:hypothetical protein [Niallia taxi]